MKKLLIIFALLVSWPVMSADTMDSEIDYLLATVAGSDCTFTRNGKDYDGAKARDHLQMKRERGKRYYSNTEEFIENLASKSSWSGKSYRIKCGDAPQTDAGDWFSALLTKHREQSTD